MTKLVRKNGFFCPLKAVFPLYHTVSDQHLPHIQHIYPYRNVAGFERDMDYLLRYYQPVELHELIADPLLIYKKPVFHLTFDDGLKEIAEIAAPLLLKKGIPATFFITPGFLDNKLLFHRNKISLLINKLQNEKLSNIILQEVGNLLNVSLKNKENLIKTLFTLNFHDTLKIDEAARILEVDFDAFLQNTKPYVTTNDVKSLINKGFTIGAHSINHPEYFLTDAQQQLEQTHQSLQYIQAQFNLNYSVFAFPFTDHKVSDGFFNQLYSTTQPACDLSFGTAGLKTDAFDRNIQRVPAEKFNTIKQAIHHNKILYPLKRIFGKHIVNRHG